MAGEERVNCPACGQQNPAEARFCNGCAAPLAGVCSACGAANPPESRFCNQCAAPLAIAPTPGTAQDPLERDPRAYTPTHLAEKILQSKSALEGERKRVTVLFADVKGSMDVQERVDPEEWHSILDRFFQILADGVHRYEGTVNQYTGDGIMALFGAPIAHEDHAQRACYAALHLLEGLRDYAREVRREHGHDFSVRMGINSGEVVVGKIGDDLRMDYTAQGHTVGLAQRMEQLAEAGSVYLAPDTATLVEGWFQLEDLGEFRIKGAREPVRVRELVGVGPTRTRLDVSRARGFSKFVGRSAEMEALDAALGRARAGTGQVVGVVAQAGTGKSRLCAEFLDRCRTRGLAVVEAHGVAYGQSIPFLPILELFRSWFGIEERDGAETAREKIAGRLLLLDESFRDALPLVFDLLGVPDPTRPGPRVDAEVRQKRLLALVKRVMHARAEQETNVTLLEDLHWFDGGSEAYLEAIVEAVPETRGLVIVNFRPEYHAHWMQRSYYQQLPLLPLGPDAIEELLEDQLGGDPSVARLPQAIHTRTAGNPFFIEEMVQSLVESGHLSGQKGAYRLTTPVEELPVPSSVQSVLAARIDRLPERDKRVLQTAAVIGRTFEEPLLREVAELPDADLTSALALLTEAEFLHEAALYPELEYRFKHPLTESVAYDSQLRERRARVHRAVARAIEEAEPDRLDECAALLAHHCERAGDALAAARWHARAAEWAGFNDPREALRHWRSVRQLIDELPESEETVRLAATACTQQLSMGWRVGASLEECGQILEDGRGFAERCGDLRSLAALMAAYAAAAGLAGDMDDYLHYAREAARAADRTDDAGLKLATASVQSFSLGFSGELAAALAFQDRALVGEEPDLQLGAEFVGYSPWLGLLQNRAWALLEMGRFEESRRELARTQQLAREHHEHAVLIWSLVLQLEWSALTGDSSRALDGALEAVEIAERVVDEASRTMAYATLGNAHLLRGENDDAVAALERSVAISIESRVNLLMRVTTLCSLARARLGQGNGRAALETAREATALGDRVKARAYTCSAQVVLARVLRETAGAGSALEIEEALQRAATLVGETGANAYAPIIVEERARAARLSGDEAACRRDLSEARRLYAEMGAVPHAERLARELG